MLNVNKIIVLALMVAIPFPAFALSTSAEQAKLVVQNWRAQSDKPLDTPLSRDVDHVQTYYDNNANVSFHIVSMVGDGFVIVSGDDRIEPIIGFIPQGTYDPNDDSFLNAMLKRDMPSRLQYINNRENTAARGISTTEPSTTDLAIEKAQNKWNTLERDLSNQKRRLSSVADVRVAPLLSTTWGQMGGVYNLHTPNQYPAGCTATAFAQVLRYFSFDAPLPTRDFDYRLSGVWAKGKLFGGDGNGGLYDWGAMLDAPTEGSPQASKDAVGRLLRDSGIAIKMSYSQSVSAGSVVKTANALVDTFGYSQAIQGGLISSNIPTEYRNNMVIPNLDAGKPVILSLSAHSVDSDGYGYDSGTLYHHINLGWKGGGNAWYALPDINSYDRVISVIYNIYTQGGGEIISGRVIDSSGVAVENAQVSTTANGTTYTATSNSKGVYALTSLPSNTTYTIAASKQGFTFGTQTVATLTSKSASFDVGNRWDVNFKDNTGSTANNPPIADAGIDQNTVLGNTVNISGNTRDDDGTVTSYRWLDGSLELATTLSFDYKVTKQGYTTLKLIVTDDDGATGESTMTVEGKINQPPVADARDDKTITLGDRVHHTGDAWDDGDGINDLHYQWFQGDVDIYAGRSYYYMPAKAGRFIHTYVVTDSGGKSGYDSMVLTVLDPNSTNQFPTVNAGSNQFSIVNQPVSIQGSAGDSDGTITSYQWMHNNKPLSNNALLNFTPTNEGEHLLVLTATDNKGGISSDVMTLTVTDASGPNQSPIVNAGEEKRVPVGQVISITGTATDNDGTIISYKWSDGSTIIATTATFDYSPTVDGTKVLTFTATDNDGAKSSDTVKVTTKLNGNILPIANAGSNKTGVVGGGSITIVGKGTDADGTVETYQWMEGSRSFFTGSPTIGIAVYTPKSAGIKKLTLVVTDNDGGIATDTMLITITDPANDAPLANAGPDMTVEMNKSVRLSGSGSDNDGTIKSYEWVKGVTHLSSNSDFDFTPTSEGDHALTLTVTDDDGATNTDTIVVTATSNAEENQSPEANAGSDIVAEVSSAVSISGSGSDTDGSIERYQWFLDSVLMSDSALFSHTFAKEGSYILTLIVTDNKGASGSDTMTVRVNKAIVTNKPPTVDAGVNRDAVVNSPIQISGTSNDSDGHIVSYQWMEGSKELADTQRFNYQASSIGDHQLTLTVTDNDGAKGSDTMTVSVVSTALISGTVLFTDNSAATISIPNDAWVGISPTPDNNQPRYWANCKIDSSGGFGGECYYEDDSVNNALKDASKTFKLVIFQNQIDPDGSSWDCAENLYKSVGKTVAFGSWSAISVSPGDADNANQDQCHGNEIVIGLQDDSQINTLTSPNGNENWVSGTDQAIQWSKSAMTGALVDIYVLDDSIQGLLGNENKQKLPNTINAKVWIKLASGIENSGQYNVDPADMSGDGEGYLVLIVSRDDKAQYDLSNAPFELSADGQAGVTTAGSSAAGGAMGVGSLWLLLLLWLRPLMSARMCDQNERARKFVFNNQR